MSPLPSLLISSLSSSFPLPHLPTSSDHLLTSDASSFGYVAAGLAGVRPYSLNIGYRTGVLNWHSSRRPVCAPAHSEPCFLAAPKQLKVPGYPTTRLP